MTEADEVEQERRERDTRKRLDEKFQRFCAQSENFAKKYGHELEFDIPFRDLTFSGCHSKANV